MNRIAAAVALATAVGGLTTASNASDQVARGLAGRPRLYLSFTMDCERIKSQCKCGGPDSWALSERAIRGFCGTLLAAGAPPTLFITPETAAQHKELFRQLRRQGVELGVHLHPQCFDDLRYDKYLAEYDAQTQNEILKQAASQWANALGATPRAFRGGNFSASPATFGVLVNLGFRQGSVSDPGRDAPQYAAQWKDACPDVHWASADNPGRPGRLPFCEVPLTTDPAKRQANGFPYELRIESGDFEKWHRPIIRKALERMAEKPPPLRVLAVFTHNYLDYSDPGVRHTQTLAGYVRHFDELKKDYEVVGATLATIRERFEALQPAEPIRQQTPPRSSTHPYLPPVLR